MKKKAKRKLPEGRSGFALRLDTDVYQRVQALAEESRISVNQLLEGVIRWAVAHAHPGECVIDPEDGEPSTKPQPGCIWFGQLGEEYEDEEGQPAWGPGHCEFQLDYTGRRVIREPEFRPVIQSRKSGKNRG